MPNNVIIVKSIGNDGSNFRRHVSTQKFGARKRESSRYSHIFAIVPPSRFARVSRPRRTHRKRGSLLTAVLGRDWSRPRRDYLEQEVPKVCVIRLVLMPAGPGACGNIASTMYSLGIVCTT